MKSNPDTIGRRIGVSTTRVAHVGKKINMWVTLTLLSCHGSIVSVSSFCWHLSAGNWRSWSIVDCDGVRRGGRDYTLRLASWNSRFYVFCESWSFYCLRIDSAVGYVWFFQNCDLSANFVYVEFAVNIYIRYIQSRPGVTKPHWWNRVRFMELSIWFFTKLIEHIYKTV